MTGEIDPANQVKFYTDKQDSEATLHWARNSYFLVAMSFLVIAYGLSLQTNSGTTDGFHALIVGMGIALNVVWMLIQYRSSQYILHYKTTAQNLSKKYNIVDPYPAQLGGVEMRKLAYCLPGIFLAFWIVLGIVMLATL
jgi:hypothetical protein